MVTELHWFVLKAVSREWGCSILETRFVVHDLAKLQSICSRSGVEYLVLDDEVAREIATVFNVRMTCDGCDYGLERWRPSVVPYLIHTNFELPLMLDGRKPLAVLSDTYPSEILDYFTAPFAPYVAGGRIVSRTIEKPFPEPIRGRNGSSFYGTIRTYFAMPDEVWRIDAYERLWEEAAVSNWNDDFERREGQLLGYTEPQIEWWIANRHNTQPR